MNTVFVILLCVVAVLALFLIPKKNRETVGGICRKVYNQITRKNENKEKAFIFIQERGSVSNEEIRSHLGVARRTVVKYMNELEKEGRVEQIGDAGRGVLYRLK
ncbi:MAG: HTH domain-containing protein [Candidatus Paceibacterota bacterium]